MDNLFISSSQRRTDMFFISNNNNNNIVPCYAEQSNVKGRQLFLRSYQFSRKKTVSERIKRFVVKVKRVILFRMRSGKKMMKRIVWSALCFRRVKRFKFLRIVNGDVGECYGIRDDDDKSSCLW